MNNLLLLIDIETVPFEASYDDLSESWRILWDKKTKFFNNPAETGLNPKDLWQTKAAVYSEFSKVVCIGIGVLNARNVEESKLYINMLSGHDERELLVSFIAEVRAIQKKYPASILAGHNIFEFDLPFLCRRMIVQKVPIPYFMPKPDSKPWDFSAYDTLRHWRFGDHKNFVSLNLLSHLLELPTSKSIMDGSQVAQYYYEKNDLPSISEYCREDIIVTSQIILRFENRPLLDTANIYPFSATSATQ